MHRQKVTKQTKSRRTPNHQNVSMELGAWSRGPDRTTAQPNHRRLQPYALRPPPSSFILHPSSSPVSCLLSPDLPPSAVRRMPHAVCSMAPVPSPSPPSALATRHQPHATGGSAASCLRSQLPAPRSTLPAFRFGRHGDPSPSAEADSGSGLVAAATHLRPFGLRFKFQASSLSQRPPQHQNLAMELGACLPARRVSPSGAETGCLATN